MDEGAIKKIAPHSSEAEQSVIGSMIVDREAIITVSEILKGEDFYRPQYTVLFNAMIEMFNENQAVDVVTLQNRLKEKDTASHISSLEFIGDLVDSVPTSANARYYAQIVKDKAVLRRMIKTTEAIAYDCYKDNESLDQILEKAEKEVFDIVQTRGTSEFVDIQDIVLTALENIEKAAKNQGSVTGVATGFYDLDFKTAGFQPSDLILIAARPSMGKTALALNIAEYVTLRSNVPTAIFSLEMSKDQLVRRMLAMNSKVDSQDIRSGSITGDGWSKLMESASIIGSSNLIIDDTSAISVGELRAKCRKLKLEKNIGMVIIDYLQLMSGSGRIESRQQEISEISRSLKALAREIDCPVVALSQLSRAVEQRPDKRPMLSDLRESGAIEQDADVVMFIYRDEYYNPETEDPGVAEVIIGKQRNGPTGTIKLSWQAKYTKFANLAR